MATEAGDEWREFNERSRMRKEHKQVSAKQMLEPLCKINDITFREITDWHFRLSKEVTIIDIYPQKNKYHNLATHQRGTYRDLLKYICSVFKITI